VGKEKDAMLLRAGAWYRQAQSALELGIVRSRVDKRLAEIAKLGRPIPLGPEETPTHRKPSLGERLLMPAGAVTPFSADEALQHQQRWAKYLRLPTEETNSVGVKLVLIPAGEFDMGSSPEEIERLLKESARAKDDPAYLDRLRSEGPRHRVKITKPFYLGACEVTRAQYWRVMGLDAAVTASRLAAKPDAASLPVDNVGWLEAQEFCRRLSAVPDEKAAGRVYRLPTEAEWEYACRAGSPGSWSGTEAAGPHKMGWFHGNATGSAHPVGQKQPNPWGLHDMHGNLREWCADWFGPDYYGRSPSADPAGPSSGVARILRGGSWRNPAHELRAADRMWAQPLLRDNNVGFRVVREL
jgi:formylglycine-generating enzyme required for sulfatase activity